MVCAVAGAADGANHVGRIRSGVALRLPAGASGEGFVDLEAFFAGLGEGGFNGYVAYEMCSPLRGGGSEQNLDRMARTALEVIRRLTV